MSSVEDKWRWVLVTAIAPVAWGSTYYVTREFLPADAPLTGAALRALPAGLLLLVLARRLPRGSWWWKALVLGVLNTSGFFALVYLAAVLLPASIASVVMALGPVMMMLMAWLLIAERPRAAGLIGALLGVGGVALMLLSGGEEVDAWGVAASVGAMTMSSLGYVLAKRWGARGEVPVLASTAWQVTAGGLVITPIALAAEGGVPDLTAAHLGGFAYLSIVCTAVAFVAWFTGLHHLAAGQVGLVGLLNPVTGVLLGVALAGEVLTLQQVAGIGVTLVGVVVGQVTWRRRRVARAPEPSPAPADAAAGQASWVNRT